MRASSLAGCVRWWVTTTTIIALIGLTSGNLGLVAAFVGAWSALFWLGAILWCYAICRS